MKNTLTSQEAELKEQYQKFNEAGYPDYDNIIQLKVYMKKELDLTGKNIKEPLLREVQENNKQIKEKLNRVINQGPTH